MEILAYRILQQTCTLAKHPLDTGKETLPLWMKRDVGDGDGYWVADTTVQSKRSMEIEGACWHRLNQGKQKKRNQSLATRLLRMKTLLFSMKYGRTLRSWTFISDPYVLCSNWKNEAAQRRAGVQVRYHRERMR